MSTRSVVATQYGDAWRGRYCHSDGYPSWNGRVLWNAIAHHPQGVDAALTQLEAFLSDDGMGAYGVSFLADPTFLADPRFQAWEPYGQSDGNVRVYRNRDGEELMGWVTPENKHYEEYLYVATKGGLLIFSTYDEEPKLLGLFRFDQEEPDWEAVEALVDA